MRARVEKVDIFGWNKYSVASLLQPLLALSSGIIRFPIRNMEDNVLEY